MTTTLVHHSPLGALSIAGVVGTPEPGEPFEVDDDIAAELLEQGDLYAPAPQTALTVAQLRDIAAERGVDITGLTRKSEIRAAIEAATENHDDEDEADADPASAPEPSAQDDTTEGVTA